MWNLYFKKGITELSTMCLDSENIFRNPSYDA